MERDLQAMTSLPFCLPQGPENNLYSQYEEKVRPCIDLIDSLRALGVEQDLALPAIAVIGDQSSGKSSVLEALSGVALPRGSGEHSPVWWSAQAALAEALRLGASTAETYFCRFWSLEA